MKANGTGEISEPDVAEQASTTFATFASDYGPADELDGSEIHSVLSSLALFNHPVLAAQSCHLSIGDRFITVLELDVLTQLRERGQASAETIAHLGTQSRMWLNSAYELMRAWRGWAVELIELHSCGALKHAPELLEAPNPRNELQAWMLQTMRADPSMVFKLRDDLKRTHIAHACLKYLCFAVADQAPGEKREVERLGVNYVGINEWCGALDYKVTAPGCSLLPINRRDIAEDIRAITEGPVPTDDDLANFDDFVRGRPLCELRARSARSSETGQVSILQAT